MANPMIAMRSVTKTYASREVLHQINLRVESGTIYGLLGVNGAGKTTAFKLLAGLLYPTSGEIVFNGQPITMRRRAFLKDMGIMIETPVFYEHLSALANLEIHLEYMGCSCSGIRSTLAAVGLGDVDDQPVSQFSLGMKQRLAIARAISHTPKLLILDEPLNGLDPLGIRQMRDLFLSLARERNMTLLISSHILSEVEQIADRVGVLADGSITQEISMPEIRAACPNGLEDYFFKIMLGGNT